MHSLPLLHLGDQLVFPDEFPFGTWRDRPLMWRVLALEEGRVWALAV